MGRYTQFGDDWQELEILSASLISPIQLRHGPEIRDIQQVGSYGVVGTTNMTLDFFNGQPHSVRIHCFADKAEIQKFNPDPYFSPNEDGGEMLTWSEVIPYANIASIATNFGPQGA